MSSETFATLIIVGWIFSIGGGLSLGYEKNRNLDGFIFPLFFGVFGLLVVALLERRWDWTCPYCRRGIPKRATRCFNCCASLPEETEERVRRG
jgi:hypothetical protein